jgi:hypothetical protein
MKKMGAKAHASQMKLCSMAGGVGIPALNSVMSSGDLLKRARLNDKRINEHWAIAIFAPADIGTRACKDMAVNAQHYGLEISSGG